MRWQAIFLPLTVVLVIGSGIFYFQNTVLNLNYQTLLYPSCDPEIESCFVEICEEEDCESEPYKKALVATSALSACTDDECVAKLCAYSSDTCQIIWCSEDELEEWEECFVPEEPEPEPIEETDLIEGSDNEE